MKYFLKKNKNVIIGMSLFAFMLTVDIVSKRLVDNLMDRWESIAVIPGIFNFYFTTPNTGAAFGLFGNSPAARIVFIIISIIAILALGFGLIKYGDKSKVLSIGLSLIMAGALGNAIDRIFTGEVIDFIEFDFWKSFPVFNFADVAVILGIIFFAVYLIFIYKEPKKEDFRESKTEDSSKESEELKKNAEEEII